MTTAGASVAVSFNNLTATVTVPAGALPSTTTVSVTLYAPAGYPHALQSKSRSTLSLGSGFAGVAEIAVSTGGVAILKPFKISLGTILTQPAGTIYRLAGYSTSFNDIDTMTFGGGSAVEDNNPAWPQASLGTALYAVYTIPTANAAPVPTPTVTVTGPTPVTATTTAQYSAESFGNGFPYLVAETYTYAVDNAALGTITSGGLLTAGTLDATGNVIATDTTAGHGNATGDEAVSISSSRPGSTGDAFTFSGSLSSSTDLTAPGGTTSAQTEATTSLSLVSNVGATSVSGSTADVTSTSVETDTYPTRTITTNTTTVNAYGLTPGNTTVAVTSTDATDSNGVEYINDYGTGNGLLDVLPETPGSFGPNNAALTYTEIDPANFGRQRTTQAAGNYTESDTDPYGDTQTITGNADFSALFDATQYDGDMFSFTAPTGGTITFTATPPAGSGYSPVTETIASWIPAGLTQPSMETDTDSGSVPFPSACNVPAKFGTTGNKLVQTIESADPALGNSTLETVTTYINQTAGPVCMVLASTTNTFYDYTGQYGYGFYYSASAQPVEVTTENETLTLQSFTSAAPASVARSTAGKSSSATLATTARSTAYVPLAFARARFERVVREHLKHNKLNFSKTLWGVHAR